MKTIRNTLLLVLILLIPVLVLTQSVYLPQTGQTTSYATGDDGDLQKGTEWPDPRFEDNGDGTITDGLTGLMWLGTELLYFDIINRAWGDVFSIVDDLNDTLNLWWNFDAQFLQVYTARYTDWHLPNLNELESLLNGEAADPAAWLNSQGFEVESAIYWSSTSVPNSNENRRVNLINGEADTWPGNTAQCYPLPVRGPFGGESLIWKTGQTESFHPGDDGDLEMGVSWPSPRFTDNGNGTVTDELTGLMWLQDANAFDYMSWGNALSSVEDFNNGSENIGFSDWRLPNRKELYSLLDLSQENPALPVGHPIVNVQNNPYWTSTTCAADVSKAFRIFMDQGKVTVLQKESDPGQWWFQARVWPVRGEVQGPSATGDVNGEPKRCTYELAQNYPNPFNPVTEIRYQIADSRSPIHTTLKIYNILGQYVRTLADEIQKPGYYTATWDGTNYHGNNVPSGIYFYQMTAGRFVQTKKMIILK